LVVGILGHQDVGQQARMRHATLDRQAGRRRLGDMPAAGADGLAPDGADHLECRRDATDLFGHVFAQRLHVVAALRAGRRGLQDMFFACEVFGQRFARGALACRGRRCRRTLACVRRVARLVCAPARRQVVEPDLEPFNLPLQLLRLAPELHALELVDLGLEPFDFQIALGHVLPQLRDRHARLHQQGLEHVDVVGKRGVIGHAAQFTQVRGGLQHR
jgi:hypothetical protein